MKYTRRTFLRTTAAHFFSRKIKKSNLKLMTYLVARYSRENFWILLPANLALDLFLSM